MSAIPASIIDPPRGLSAFRPRAPEPLRGFDLAAAGTLALIAACTRTTSRFMSAAGRADALHDRLRSLSESALNQEIASAREVFRRGRAGDGAAEHAAAVIRETAGREMGQRHHLVQLAGGLAVHNRCIAEMATGEGKTLAIVVPAAMWGWRGRGMHVITANDYLAARDAQWMTPLYRRLGLTVAPVIGASGTNERRKGYAADVTYTTAKEAAADLLRDRLRESTSPPMLRGLAAAIVDEADVVLIDDAATPLILSGAEGDESLAAASQAARVVAERLIEGEHFQLSPRHREAELTSVGIDASDRIFDELSRREPRAGGRWSGARAREELLRRALEARWLFERDREYVIIDGKVVIVDESTGRTMPDRTWRDGVQQAIEAKEGLKISPLSGVHARISFQRFFRLYATLGGVTGTARECARELWNVYGLHTVRVPTNQPCARKELPPTAVDSSEAAHGAAADLAAASRAVGRPVLIGTRSVGESMAMSAALAARGIEHEVLNALSHEHEARIIARAGEAGAVTIATNMAGRGTVSTIHPRKYSTSFGDE